jgi:YidC/Oxa1 family membrane protein insertase
VQTGKSFGSDFTSELDAKASRGGNDMDIWTHWLTVIHGLLTYLSSNFGFGTGLGIILLTIILRTLILPISWSSAYRACVRQKKMARLQPQLQRLQQECGAEPRLYMARVRDVYRAHGMTLMDWRSLAGTLVQLPLFLGMYQSLRGLANGARFLWIQSLSRPDIWLALLAGVTTFWMMSTNPDLPQHMRVIMIVVPAVIAVIATLKVCSALAIYWSVSNCYSAIQTTAMHYVVAKRIKAGVITI